MKALVTLLRLAWHRVEDWPDDWLMEYHRPYFTGDELVCPRCWTKAPCEPFMAACDRRWERRKRRAMRDA